MSTNIHAEQKPLIYQIGKHVKLVDDATFCKSIIADGKELITGKESGEIRVPELNDEKVYITFKKNVTDFSDTFSGCSALKSIPEKLFANNTKVTNFSYTFKNCSALIGESPYTMIDGQKVHLYERVNYPEHFTTPTSTYHAFGNCTGLTDYAQIPTNWKE